MPATPINLAAPDTNSPDAYITDDEETERRALEEDLRCGRISAKEYSNHVARRVSKRHKGANEAMQLAFIKYPCAAFERSAFPSVNKIRKNNKTQEDRDCNN